MAKVKLQVPAKLKPDKRSQAIRSAQPCISKVDYIFDAQCRANAKIRRGRKPHRELIVLFVKGFAVPVGFAAAYECVEIGLCRTVHIKEKLEFLFELFARLVFGSVVVCGEANAAKKAIAVGAPRAAHGGYEILIVDAINKA